MMKRLGLAGAAVLVVLALSPFLSAAASAQTTQSVCAEPGQPCAGTPFAQVGSPPAPAPAAADDSNGALARTGVNTEHLLLVSVAALAFGCLVLLFVEAREGSYALQPNRSRGSGK